jgi:hypothetical protein
MAYTVKQGDTLSQLYGADWKNLSGYTGDPTKLQIGTQLNDLPGSPNVISSTTMAPVPTVPVAMPTLNTTTYPVGITQDLQAKADAAQKVYDDQNAANLKQSNDIAGMQSVLGGQAAETKALYDTTGVSDLAKQLKELATQAINVDLGTKAQNLALDQQGMTQGAVNNMSNANIRESAIKLLGISQQSNILQGNYDTAKANADAIINAKYFQLENDLKAKQIQLQGLKDYVLTLAQEKRAETQKNLLAKQASDLADAKQTAKDNSNLALDYAKYAYDGGQSQLASQITALDTTSPTFKQDFAKLQSQIQNPMAKLDIAIKQQQLAKAQKETALLGAPSISETKATTAALQSAKNSVPVIQDKLDLIDILKTSPGLAERVGPNALSRLSPATNKGLTGIPGNLIGGIKNIFMHPINEITGKGEQFKGGIQRLTTGLSLDALIKAKQQGATFGALSDAEMRILANSATQLNNWEIKDDKGNPTGVWNIDQKSFVTELNRIRTFLQKSLETAQGTTMTPDEQSTMDELFTNQDASSFYGN